MKSSITGIYSFGWPSRTVLYQRPLPAGNTHARAPTPRLGREGEAGGPSTVGHQVALWDASRPPVKSRARPEASSRGRSLQDLTAPTAWGGGQKRWKPFLGCTPAPQPQAGNFPRSSGWGSERSLARGLQLGSGSFTFPHLIGCQRRRHWAPRRPPSQALLLPGWALSCLPSPS